MPRILAGVTLNLALASARVGLDPQALLEGAGLRLSDLLDRDATVDLEKHVALARAIAAARPDANLGLEIGRSLDSDHLGVLGFAMSNALTVRAALQCFVRYQGFLSDVLSWSFQAEGTSTCLRGTQRPDLPLGIPVEAALTGILAVCRKVCLQEEGELRPTRVRFAHSRRGPAGQHEAFYGCSVLFEAPANEMNFASEALDREIPGAETSLGLSMTAHIDAVLRGQADNEVSVAARVRRLAATRLGRATMSQDSIARAMGLSGRTLSRRLANEGTSLGEQLATVRRELAMRYLADPDLAVYEVAFLLGYSEPSTFHRAFKAWTGETPASARARLRTGNRE